MSASDEFFMRGALVMARRSLGQAWPNPAVGAVVVQPGAHPEIIARASTMPGGRPHAETIALEKAGESAKGATLYVTLEPCAHQGKTPPCTSAIIDAGIKRVVVSATDPDPRVAGAGIGALKEHAIEVITGVLEDEGRDIARGHILRVTKKRPLIQLKLAVGSDGLVPRGSGKPTWITGRSARAHGHLLRARADAILVGRGTLEADDPSLTCRLPCMLHRSPVRVVLDTHLSLTRESQLLTDAEMTPVWIFCSGTADGNMAEDLEKAGCEIFRINTTPSGGLDPVSVATSLAEQGITRLLIEGGPRVAASFCSSTLVDEIFMYQGAQPAGSDGLQALPPHGIESIRDSGKFSVRETRRFDEDKLTVLTRRDE